MQGRRVLHRPGENGSTRLCYLAAGGLMGLFLALRLRAFLVQSWGMVLPLRLVGLLSPGLALLGALLSPAVRGHLCRWALGSARWRWGVYALSVAGCLRWRGIVLDRPLEGAGLWLPGWVNLLALAGGGVLLGVFLLHLLFALGECLPGLARWVRGLRRRDWLTLLGLWLAVNLAVFAYASGSQTLYGWDSAIYWRSTYALAETFRDQGVLAALRQVYESIFTSDYNDTIGLLCVPFALLFGPSRRVYLMSIGNFCLFPLLTLLWAFARSRRRPGLWLALAAILALPSLFYTAVTGFVDIAGVIPAALGLILCLREEGKGRFSRFLLIGVLCALAVVLRRWYAFYALSVLLALLVEAAAFRRSPAPVLGYLCGMGFPLLFFLQTFVSQRLLADYAAQYAAYDLGLGVDFRMLFRYYGIWLLLAALALGVWLALRREDRRKGVFLLLEPSVCFFLFVQVQSHGQQHLLLYVPALACLLILGFDRLADRGRLGALAVAAAVVPTAVSPALPRTQGSVIQDYPLFMPLPTFSYAPPVREDAWEVVGLLRRLDEFGAEGKQVGLLASSFTLNASLLRYAEDSLNAGRVSDVDRSYLATLSEVDSRDGLSGALYACEILAVADPIQLHLGRENQQAIWAPAHCLLEGEAIAGAYRRLEETYTLESDGITVYFFEKVREPTAEEMQALAELVHRTNPDMYVYTG